MQKQLVFYHLKNFKVVRISNNVCITSMLPQEISVVFITLLSQTLSVWPFSFRHIEVILALFQYNFDVKMHVKRDIVFFWNCSVYMYLYLPLCVSSPLCFPNTTAFNQSHFSSSANFPLSRISTMGWKEAGYICFH